MLPLPELLVVQIVVEVGLLSPGQYIFLGIFILLLVSHLRLYVILVVVFVFKLRMGMGA
jgi:hypothetical protein